MYDKIGQRIVDFCMVNPPVLNYCCPFDSVCKWRVYMCTCDRDYPYALMSLWCLHQFCKPGSYVVELIDGGLSYDNYKRLIELFPFVVPSAMDIIKPDASSGDRLNSTYWDYQWKMMQDGLSIKEPYFAHMGSDFIVLEDVLEKSEFLLKKKEGAQVSSCEYYERKYIACHFDQTVTGLGVWDDVVTLLSDNGTIDLIEEFFPSFWETINVRKYMWVAVNSGMELFSARKLAELLDPLILEVLDANRNKLPFWCDLTPFLLAYEKSIPHIRVTHETHCRLSPALIFDSVLSSYGSHYWKAIHRINRSKLVAEMVLDYMRTFYRQICY